VLLRDVFLTFAEAPEFPVDDIFVIEARKSLVAYGIEEFCEMFENIVVLLLLDRDGL
jgi:hypothetical protein